MSLKRDGLLLERRTCEQALEELLKQSAPKNIPW
jgi:hypothetical protein